MRYIKLFENNSPVSSVFGTKDRTYVVRFTHTRDGITETSVFFKRTFNIDDAFSAVTQLKNSFLSLDLLDWTLNDYFIEEHGVSLLGFPAHRPYMDRETIDAAIEGEKYNL